MKNALYGMLFGSLTFGALAWSIPRQAVRAAPLPAPPEHRFELVQLHPSTDTEWSAILDSETGCIWVYTTNNADDPKITDQGYKNYLSVLGRNSFDLVNFDATDYLPPSFASDNKPNYVASAQELARVQSLCSQARLRALQSESIH